MILRPPVLRPDDLVRLVSPSGPPPPDRLERGVALLESWGLRVSVAPHALDRAGYLAGGDAARLGDLTDALCAPEVRAVICTRGGYGAQRIVDALPHEAVLADPKLLVGFSDITALHLGLWRTARLASVYGPGAAWFDPRTPEVSADALRRVIMTTEPVEVTAGPAEPTHAVRFDGPPVTGPLLGGNLCLLAATAGTPDLPDLTGAVVLLEDVFEAPYKVDRMLTQLERAGALGPHVAGVAVGQFTDCVDSLGVPVEEVLRERLGRLGVPVLGGLPIGHGVGQIAVPLGTPATLDVAAGTLVVEPAVA